jgi:hypothetical protein
MSAGSGACARAKAAVTSKIAIPTENFILFASDYYKYATSHSKNVLYHSRLFFRSPHVAKTPARRQRYNTSRDQFMGTALGVSYNVIGQLANPFDFEFDRVACLQEAAHF